MRVQIPSEEGIHRIALRILQDDAYLRAHVDLARQSPEQVLRQQETLGGFSKEIGARIERQQGTRIQRRARRDDLALRERAPVGPRAHGHAAAIGLRALHEQVTGIASDDGDKAFDEDAFTVPTLPGLQVVPV